MKYRVIIFVFYFLFLTFQLLAADTWIKTYQPFYNPNVENDYFPEDIVVCQDGGYAVNGYYNHYDPEYGIDQDWGFLIKTDGDGNLLWTRRDTVDFMSWNRSYAFVETSDGDFISIGYSYSSGYIIKRDSEGNRIWANPYNDFGTNSMDNTDDGNIILGGVVESNIALRKIDNNGNTIWTKSYNCGNVAIATSIIQTIDGGYTLTGYVSGNGYDIIVMKTDEYGDSLWTRTYDGYGFIDSGKSITQDSSGNIMVAGEILNPYTTGFLWYLDYNGNTIWEQEVDSSVGYSHPGILYNNYRGIFVSTCQTTTGAKLYGFNANYNIYWDNIFSGWSGEGDKSLKVTVSYGYVCALFNVGGSLEDNIGIAKTDSLGQVFAIDEYEIPHTHEITLSNYPNPFSSTTTICYYLPLTIRNPIIEIYNIKGQCIRTFKIENEKCKIGEVVWDGKDESNNHVSSGIYYVKLSDDKGINKTAEMILTK